MLKILVYMIFTLNPSIYWNNLTPEEKAHYRNYFDFEERYYRSIEYGDLHDFPDSFYIIGKAPGKLSPTIIWDMVAYKDTLFFTVLGYDRVMKFTSDGKYIAQFGNRVLLHYTHGIAINDDYIWVSRGQTPKTYILRKDNLSISSDEYFLIVRAVMDDDRTYVIRNLGFNDNTGSLYVFPDSSFDILYHFGGRFTGIDIDSQYIWLSENALESPYFRVYRINKDYTDTCVYRVSKYTINIAVNDDKVFVLEQGSGYNFVVEVYDKSTMDFITSFSFHALPSYHFTRGSLEVIGDTVYIAHKDSPYEALEKWKVDRYLSDGTYLGSFLEEPKRGTYSPSYTMIKGGYIISSSEYEWGKVTFRYPDGKIAKEINLHKNIIKFDYEPKKDILAVSTEWKGFINIYILRDGEIIGRISFGNGSWIYDLFIKNDTLIFKRGNKIYFYDLKATLLDTLVLPFDTRDGRLGILRDYLVILNGYKMTVFKKNGIIIADIPLQKYFYSFHINEGTNGIKIAFSRNNSGDSPIYIYSLSPNYQLNFLKTIGSPLYKSIWPSYEWIDNPDSFYFSNPDYFIFADPYLMDNKIILTDLHNRRVIIKLLSDIIFPGDGLKIEEPSIISPNEYITLYRINGQKIYEGPFNFIKTLNLPFDIYIVKSNLKTQKILLGGKR